MWVPRQYPLGRLYLTQSMRHLPQIMLLDHSPISRVWSYLMALVFASIPLGAIAQTIDSADDLTAFIRTEMEANRIPGAQVFASKGGEQVYYEALGLANADDGTPMTEQTLSLLASVSKPVTGIALLTLVDKGQIALDDPINDYLPFDVEHPDHPDTDITPRMLLTHQSGIVDSNTDLDVEGDSPISLASFIEDLLTPGGRFYSTDNFGDKPGTSTLYSNDGIALIGFLVEAVSKMSFEEYCQSALFTPLGMNRTSWFLSGLTGQPIARPHLQDGNSFTALPNPGFPDYPAGQLRTSPNQLARLLQMVQDGGTLGGETILQSSTVEAMLTPSSAGTGSEGDDQGFVWYRTTRNGRVSWEHNGSVEGITTLALMLTDDDVNVIVLTNGEEVEIDGIVDAAIDFALKATLTSAAESRTLYTAPLAIANVAPNPFSEASRLTVSVVDPQSVRVSLHDVLGREVGVLHHGLVSGSVPIAIDGSTLPAGLYVVRAQGRTVSASHVITRVR